MWWGLDARPPSFSPGGASPGHRLQHCHTSSSNVICDLHRVWGADMGRVVPPFLGPEVASGGTSAAPGLQVWTWLPAALLGLDSGFSHAGLLVDRCRTPFVRVTVFFFILWVLVSTCDICEGLAPSPSPESRAD